MTLLYDSKGKRESDETILKLLSAGTVLLKHLEENQEAEERVAALRASCGTNKSKVMRWRRYEKKS